MSSNVAFTNIDWTSSRMNRTLDANMRLLAETIAGIVRSMNPTIISLCEVGEAKLPLSEEHMQQIKTQGCEIKFGIKMVTAIDIDMDRYRYRYRYVYMYVHI